jgi:pimeloyl-ACP methyl ester carboxylesterase
MARARGLGPLTVTATDGFRIAIHDFGGDGPPLLLAHATGMHGWIWKPVADHLVDRAHCVALDLRGHGDSEVPDGTDLSWNCFASDVLAAARELGGSEIIGVGHSLGGAALIMAELEAPGTFEQLFLYEPALNAELGGQDWESLLVFRDAMVEMTARRRGSFPSRAEALANYVGKPPMDQFQAATLGAYVEHGFSDQDDSRGKSVSLKCAPETEARIYAATYDHDTGGRLHAITCPVTVASGSETGELQRKSVETLAARFGWTHVVLADADHFGPLQQPKQFAAMVARHTVASE